MIAVYYVTELKKVNANFVFLDSIFLTLIPVVNNVLLDIMPMIKLEDVTDVTQMYAQPVSKPLITVLLVLQEDLWLMAGVKISVL
jgi:hypothetical protein